MCSYCTGPVVRMLELFALFLLLEKHQASFVLLWWVYAHFWNTPMVYRCGLLFEVNTCKFP